MKTISFFAICFGISFCIAQTNTDSEYNSTGNEYNSGGETYPATDENMENNSGEGEYSRQENSSGSGDGWDRTDYYESAKQPERVQYYSGSHRGTNIINPINDQYDAREGSGNSRGTDFPDVVRQYSGGHYGNNIINKDRVDKVKDAYMNNPVDQIEYNRQDNYQNHSGSEDIPEDSMQPDDNTVQPNE